ncbi:MAG: helix-turn-helix transcriptional regulator [Lactobacillus sp.]|nr:helix-turn-helix transcriptional regulator [Lactobacillus sp.]
MKLTPDWNCGVAKAMTILGGKWRLNIIWALSKQDQIRFNQLKRDVKGITNVMLTRSLAALIAEQLVVRHDFQTVPPHVTYALTAKGQSLIPIVKNLNVWGQANL